MDYKCYYDHAQKCWVTFLPGEQWSTSHPDKPDKAIETFERIQRGEFQHMAWRTVPRIDVRA